MRSHLSPAGSGNHAGLNRPWGLWGADEARVPPTSADPPIFVTSNRCDIGVSRALGSNE